MGVDASLRVSQLELMYRLGSTNGNQNIALAHPMQIVLSFGPTSTMVIK